MIAVEPLPTASAPDIPGPYRIVERRVEAHDVVTLAVVPLRGGVPAFRPAQFSMIGVAGVGEVPISISSNAADDSTLAYTVRRAGAVTAALCTREVGDVVTVRGPFGVPWDLDRVRGRHALFVAGGIGLAPLRAAIEECIGELSPECRVTVLVGAKEPDDMPYRRWLAGLSAHGVRIGLTVDHVRVAGEWGGSIGLVTDQIADVVTEPDLVEAFVCGPDAMMSASVTALVRLGVPAHRIELTLERNMHCANGWCGHCQLGPILICRDGPVVRADRLGGLLDRSEL